MSPLAFTHPWALIPGAVVAGLALTFGFWAQLRPGRSLAVVGQRPWRLGLGMALVVAGLSLGLAEPRWGSPEVSRLTVHIALDASRSMTVPDCQGRSRWQEALRVLDRLWASPLPGVRYSLDLVTGDAIPLMPPGEDRVLLREALRVVTPGEVGAVGTSFGKALPQVAAQADPQAPALLLVLSDGEETWEKPEAAVERASAFLRQHHLPVVAMALGQPEPQPVIAPAQAEGPSEPLVSRAQPDTLRRLAEATGGRFLSPDADLTSLLTAYAQGRAPLPAKRSHLPAHPEWGAWVALLGLGIWAFGAGRPLRAWRLAPILALGLFGRPAQAQFPVPSSVEAWLAQRALERGDAAAARRWRPTGNAPLHRLIAAQVDLKAQAPGQALVTLTPLTGQGVPRPVPTWRAPALLLAARAQVALQKPDEARTLLERLLQEIPGQEDAIHDLQSLLEPQAPPPPKPKNPPPPPPRRQGAREDEQEGLRQRLPQRPKPQGGIKDL